jgi:hypothetical protein
MKNLVQARNPVVRDPLNANNTITAILAIVSVGIILSLMIGGEQAVRSWPSVSYLLRINPLNTYFVKFGWFWTLAPLIGVYVLEYLRRDGDRVVALATPTAASRRLIRRLLFLLLATLIWYGIVQAFDVVLQATGICSDGMHVTLHACKSSEQQWHGFDISGHCFLLIYSSLIYAYDGPVVFSNTQPYSNIVEQLLYWTIAFVRIVWLLMLFITATFFHDTLSKILGTCFGFMSWMLLDWLNSKIKR